MSSSLKTIRNVFENEVNCVTICENEGATGHERWTVINIKDHGTARRFLDVYEKAGISVDDGDFRCYSVGDEYHVMYPYLRERPLRDFYMGGALTVAECEEICRNLIIACMTCGLPAPMLYLALRQGLVHLAVDRSVYLSYMFDLKDLDENITEKECVHACAEILREILEVKAKQKADSYILLEKKIMRESYVRFTELYKDLEVAGERKRNFNILGQIRYWFESHKDVLFRILLVVVTLLVIFTLITLITNAIFGDIPWMRLFIKSFEKIGLESLLQ